MASAPFQPPLTGPCGYGIWTAANWCATVGHLDAVNSVAVTPEGERAISASSDRTLRVWDLEKGQLVRTLEGHLDGVNVVVPMPDGRRAISGSADHLENVGLRNWPIGADA